MPSHADETAGAVPSGGGRRTPRPARAALLTTLLPALLVGAAVLATALAGPITVGWHDAPGWLGLDIPPMPEPAAQPQGPPGEDVTDGPSIPAWVGEVVRWVAVALVVAVVVVLVALVVRALRDRWRAIDKAERVAAPAGGATGGELDEPARAEIQRGLAQAGAALRAALPPGDAVVAAWLALERAAAGCGVERAPAATASEFTLSLLDRTPADPRAARTLLGLYHRARFSGHAVGEADVRAAAAALDVLDRALVPR